MNKHPLAIVILGLATALAGTPALGFDDERLYVGAGPGLSHLAPATGNSGYSVEDGRDRGGKLYLGYDLTEALSVEGYYADMGEAELAPSGRLGYADYGVSGVYYFYQPAETRRGLSAFARMGVGSMQNDGSVEIERSNDHHLMIGAGLEYGLGKGFALRADYDMYDADAHLFAVTLLKRFGGGGPVVVPPQDSDGDGVVDGQDLCPQTPRGDAVDALGCSLPQDGDGDGVLDLQDQCPDTAAGEKVDATGCSLPLDSDGDGVLDPQDQCPDTASGDKVDVVGCLLAAVIELKGVEFALNSAELIGNSGRILDEMAETLKRYPEMQLEVAGYTDSQGNAAYNKKLSARRANAVRDYLVGQGVAADNLTATGYGEEGPIADNDSAEGRARNRRVELHISK